MTGYDSHRYTSSCGRLTLFARIYPGEGPTLLLMHGLTRNSSDFEPLVPALAGKYRLIVPDQRGRGLSDYDPEPARYRPDIYAQDMFALLASLNVTEVGLIGTSMGGLISMVMTALKPDMVRSIVLNDVGPVLDKAGLDRISSYVGSIGPYATLRDVALACEASNRDAFPDFHEIDWMDFARRTSRERPDGQFEFAYDPAIAAGFADVGDTPQADLWPLWATLDGKPVLVLRGVLSLLLSGATLDEMGKRHKGTFEAVEIAGRGHAPLLDEPAAVTAITEFLAEQLA